MMLQGFFSGDQQPLTPEQVERLRNSSGAAALAGADTTPVAHWSAGLARMVDALGGYRGNIRADKAEEAGLASADEAIRGNPIIASLLGGDQAAMQAPSPIATTSGSPVVDALSGGMNLRDGIVQTAQAIGADPVDLATAISYETAGTFDPTKAGPTTQWGQHRGLIQFGEPQAQQYGVDFSSPEAALSSQLGADGAIAKYFRSSGFKPGMSGMDLYSTINAGAPGRYGASDANNGGAPGDVADKWNTQMSGHREKAMALLGGDYTPSVPAALSGGGGMPQQAPSSVVAALAQAQSNPWVAEKYGGVIDALMGQEMQRSNAAYQQQLRQQDPMYQAQLQQAQLQNEALRNPVPEPQSLMNAGGGNIYDPNTGQWIIAPRGPVAPMSSLGKLEADRAAGLISDEAYQAELASMAPKGMAIESDGQGGFRMVQGAGVTGDSRPFTEGQSKDVVYSTRARGALETLDPRADALTNRGELAAEMVPFGLGREWQSDQFQVAKNAGDEFLQAILRKDTGAAITAQEQALYGKTYLPQPGDSAAVMAQKAEARQRAVAAIEAGMSPSQMIAQERGLAASTPDAPPAPGIPDGIDPADWEFMTPEERALFQ